MDRFWPSLIDRLDAAETDGGPPIDDHFVDQKTLRDMIKKSLENLLNTVHLESYEPLEGYERMRASVLNYGVPDVTGKITRTLDAYQLEQRMRMAILTFEPRFRPESLRVSVVNRTDDGRVDAERPLELSIEGEIWATPTPERVILRTMLDLEGAGAQVEVE